MSEAAAIDDAHAVPPGAACEVHDGEAASFVCSRCGTFGCEACVFSRIASREVCRACAAKGLGRPIPWEQRRELGSWRAFWQTVRLVSRQPTAFFRTPPTDGGIVMPVLHGTLTYSVGLLLTYVILGLTMMLGGGGVAAFDETQTMGPLAGMLGTYGCAFVGLGPFGALLSIPSTLLSIVVAAGASHGVLALFKRTKGSFEDTLRAVSYANAPYVWSWIPLFGGLVAYVWMVWAETIAIRETHGCGTDWAILATVGYRVVLLLLVVSVYAAFFLAAFVAMRDGS